MKRIEELDGWECQLPNCHRQAIWETSSGVELCSACARKHQEWENRVEE